MISNPGQAQSSTTMLTTTYDTTNKKQDIFSYTDSKVADKVTSAQVATQISSATANFVTSSQLTAETTKLSPRMWSSIALAPFRSDPNTYYSFSSTMDESNVTLPIPVYMSKYYYQFHILLMGLNIYFASGTSSVNSTGLQIYLSNGTKDGKIDPNPRVTTSVNANTHLTWSDAQKYSETDVWTCQNPKMKMSRTRGYVGNEYKNGDQITITTSSSAQLADVYNVDCPYIHMYFMNMHNYVYETFGIIFSYRAYALK